MSAGHFSTAKTREYRGHTGKINTVGWSLDGRYFASGSLDRTVKIWNLERTSKELDLKAHTDSIDQLAWSPISSHVLATASSDRTVKLWDTKSGKSTGSVSTEGLNINLTWSGDGNTIVAGRKDDVMVFIDVRKMAKIAEKRMEMEINEIAFNYEGDLFLMTSGLGTIIVMEYPSWKEVVAYKAHTANCICLRYDPKGRYFASGSADALISIWDAYQFICLRTLGKLEHPVRTLGFSYDSQYIAAGSEDKFIDISHVETGESVYQLPVVSAINAVSWHPKEHLLLFGGEEKDALMAPSSHHEGIVRVFGFPASSS